MKIILPLILTILLVSCTENAPWPNKGIYSGFLIYGFEKSIFQPAGTQEKWWLHKPNNILRSDDIKQHCIDKIQNECIVYIAIQGELSLPGKYGHLGQFKRELHMQKLLHIRPATELKASNK